MVTKRHRIFTDKAYNLVIFSLLLFPSDLSEDV
jgi:hypothetical protein